MVIYFGLNGTLYHVGACGMNFTQKGLGNRLHIVVYLYT